MRVRPLILLVLLVGLSHPAAAQKSEAAYHFSVARLLAGEGRADEAVREFERALELDPADPALRAEYADLLFRMRRVRAAVEQIDRAYELAPDDADVLRLYGQIHFALAPRDANSLERAREAFERLREIEPRDISAMLTLAQIYEGAGRLDDALEVVREVVSHHPDNRQLNRVLVEVLRQTGRAEEAEEALREILRLDNEALESRLEMARIESERGHHSEAIDILSSAGAEIAGHPQLRRMLAEEHLRRAVSAGIDPEQRSQDLERAAELIAALEEAGAVDPGLALLDAEVRWERGEREAALAVLERTHRQSPDNAWVALRFAARLEELDRRAEAAQVLRAAVAANEDERGARVLREQLLGLQIRREDWEAVAGLAGDLLREREPGPERTEIFGYYLEALIESGHPDEALDAVREEIGLSGRSNVLTLSEAKVLAELGRRGRALKVLERDLDLAAMAPVEIFRLGLVVEEIEQSDELAERAGPLLSFRLGQALSLRSSFDEALPLLERAVAAESEALPESLASEGLYWLGQAQERTGRYDAAATSFERVLELDSDNAQAMNYLGYMWADLGRNLERALELTRKAVAAEPDNGAFVDSLGWALFRLGRYAEAREQLERAAELVPGDPTVLEHLGDVYVALGELAQARAAYEQALEVNDEENVEAVRRKLADLEGL